MSTPKLPKGWSGGYVMADLPVKCLWCNRLLPRLGYWHVIDRTNTCHRFCSLSCQSQWFEDLADPNPTD